MQQRTINRFNEHVAMGHTLRIENVISLHQPGKRLFKCSCKWWGWLNKPDMETLGWIQTE